MRGVIVCVLVASAAQAYAGPRVAIRARGTCPSAAAIEAALPDRAPNSGSVEIAVEEIDGGVIVRATSSTGPLEAKLDGRDCGVLASAVAAIADAWFVELAPPAPPPVAPAPALETHPAQVDAESATDRERTPPWNIAVGRAFLFADQASLSATTRVEVGWELHRLARLHARFDLGDTMTLDDLVRRRALATVLTLGPRLDHGRFWLEGAAGAGLVFSRVEKMMPADEVIRAHGAFAGAAAAGIRLGSGASLRVDVDGLLYPVRDVYTVESAAIARSPRYELAAGVGLEIAFGVRSR